MSVAKVSLLLLLALIGSNAAPSAEECQALTKKLHGENLKKIYGEWVLVWSVSSNDMGHELLKNLTHSHTELKLLNDNTTIEYIEKNTLINACTTYSAKMTVPSDDNSTITYHSMRLEEGGVVTEHNEAVNIEFYDSCSDCLLMFFKSPSYNFLLSYKKKGSHQDVEQNKATHDDHKKLAECLGLPYDKPYIYDGVSDSCHNKPASTANPEQP